MGPAVERLARRARRLTPVGMMDHLERRVLLAGVPEAWPMERVLAGKLMLGAGAAGLGGLLFIQAPGPGGCSWPSPAPPWRGSSPTCCCTTRPRSASSRSNRPCRTSSTR